MRRRPRRAPGSDVGAPRRTADGLGGHRRRAVLGRFLRVVGRMRFGAMNRFRRAF